MGIEPGGVNVTDLAITRPDRSGPGGDIVGTASIGADLSAVHDERERKFRNGQGAEVVVLGSFFFNPILDSLGALVEPLPGDLAQWTNAFGRQVEPQEIVLVKPHNDCNDQLDTIEIAVGSSSGAGGS